MKKKIEDKANEKMAEPNEEIITRAQALKKVGYIAVSAATMMILLSNPNKAQAASPSAPAAPGAWG